MSNVSSNWMQGTVQESYSDAALARALSKYSFRFKIDGVVCRAWYDRSNNELLIDGPDKGGELPDFVDALEAIIRENKSGLDPLDVRRFLWKHLQATTKVEQALQRVPVSERRFELMDSEHIDMNGMSLEDQCVLEVLQEQSEKANQVAIANGTPEDVKYEVTAEMVEAKMQEKTRQPK